MEADCLSVFCYWATNERKTYGYFLNAWQALNSWVQNVTHKPFCPLAYTIFKAHKKLIFFFLFKENNK